MLVFSRTSKKIKKMTNFPCLEIVEIDMWGQFCAEKNDCRYKNSFFLTLNPSFEG